MQRLCAATFLLISSCTLSSSDPSLRHVCLRHASVLTAKQPPLQFYLHVMRSKPWDRIDIVTYADRPENRNPVVHVLMRAKSVGKLKGNVNIHTVSRCLKYSRNGQITIYDRSSTVDPIFASTICCARGVWCRSQSTSTGARFCHADPARQTNGILTVKMT